jgi:hypothetical protein
MRDGINVWGLMSIQKASDSIRSPLPPPMRTRFSHHRVEAAEHQRRELRIISEGTTTPHANWPEPRGLGQLDSGRNRHCACFAAPQGDRWRTRIRGRVSAHG